jgi:hypothetical protein
MVGGRLNRFCFPLMKIVMNSNCRRFLSAFSRVVSFRFGFAIFTICFESTQNAGLSITHAPANAHR